MADEIDIPLPAHGFTPRPDQMALWTYLEQGGKRAVEVAHRRWGKDEIALHYTACAAHQRLGGYWHMLPQFNQCRKAVWEAINPKTGRRRIDDAFPQELRASTRNTDMYIEFLNGSSWQLVGSDNYNALVGSPPVGIVFSEYALSDPSCWAYLSPILEENGGWAAFISTSRGNNHLKKILDFGRITPGWFAQTLTAHETPVFTEQRLVEIKAELMGTFGQEYGEAMYAQEYECFPGGTKIWTIVGQKSIELIAVNDVVLTHAGRWRKVTKTFQKEQADGLVEIQSAGCSKPIRSTDNHPVRLCDPSSQTYRWCPAQNVKVGDYVVLPRIKIPLIPIIDIGLAELIAWFIAEGSVAKNLITFSLNKIEVLYAERIMAIGVRYGKAYSYVSDTGTALQVVVNSSWLADFLTTHCGSGASHKRIPWHLIAGHEELVYETLINGDGCRGSYGSATEVYSTVSYSLALDMQMLAHMIGKRARINKLPAHKQSQTIEGRPVHVSDSYNVFMANHHRKRCGRPKVLPLKHGVASLVSAVSLIPFRGLVYNFAVQYDESYVAEGRVVHNCSFQGAVLGAYFANQMTAARREGRITKVPHATGLEVYTFWDLGVDDSTTIWFMQFVGHEVRIIDYYEKSGMGMAHFAKILKGQEKGSEHRKEYVYGDHYMPHDAKQRMMTGTDKAKSKMEVAEDLGIKPVKLVSRARDSEAVMAGIEACRNMLPMCIFDEERCIEGIAALEGYKSEYDEEKKILKNTPYHDWTSHGCLAADTLILTDQGEIPIKDVTTKHYVWTPMGYARVLDCGPTKISNQMIEFSLSTGKVLRCTPEHKILTKNGFVIADALRYVRHMFSGGELSCKVISYLSMVTNLGYRETVTAKTAGVNLAQQILPVLFGNFIMDRFRKGLRFITRTKIPFMMKFPTMNFCPSPNIREIMPEQEFAVDSCYHQTMNVEQGQLNGMGLRRDSNGINNMGSKSGNIESGIRAFAKSVLNLSCRLILRGSNTAIQIVSQKRCDGVKELVYDLTIENHACYQANGVLVSNSDAFRTFAVGYKPKSKSKPGNRRVLSGWAA